MKKSDSRALPAIKTGAVSVARARKAARIAKAARPSSAAISSKQLYALRERHGLTQKELASLVGTTQSAIARLEDANYEGHSLSLLTRIAAAVGERVRVTFEQPVERAAGRPPAR